MTHPRPVSRRALLAAAGAAGLVVLGGARQAVAHRAHVILTRLSRNPRTARWEFVHTLHQHDAQLALYQLSGGREVELSTPAAIARCMLELERRVRWFDAAGRPLAPVAVGGELEGDGLVLYQEMPAPERGGRFAVESKLLQDLFADQRHTVSIELRAPYARVTLDTSTPRANFDVA
jgi:hypothetical protein